MNKTKRWTISLLCAVLGVMVLLGGFVVFIDPFFHYHGPLKNVEYALYNERYQNDGILKHFDYDAAIVGTSMTENFKTSELNEIFGVTSVKAPFAGGTYKEIGDLQKVALENNPNLKMIVRGLDYYQLLVDKDYIEYSDEIYPDYLYDKNPFNDVKYIFNMTVLLQSIQNVIGIDADGKIETSFDKYANWMDRSQFGNSAVNSKYDRAAMSYVGAQKPMTDEDYETVKGTVEQNIIQYAKDYPDVDFYLFFTPYSIYYMDFFYLNGDMQRQLMAEKYAIEMMLEYDNIHLYSFFDNHEQMWNLDEYRDGGHYGDMVNTRILHWMHDGVGLLTKENYEDYCKEEYDYFMNLDYDAMYRELSGRDVDLID